MVVNCIGAACGFNVDSRHFDRRILHAGASNMVDFHLTDTYCIGSWIAIPSQVICPSAFDPGSWIDIPRQVICPSAFDHGCWIAIPIHDTVLSALAQVRQQTSVSIGSTRLSSQSARHAKCLLANVNAAGAHHFCMATAMSRLVGKVGVWFAIRCGVMVS